MYNNWHHIFKDINLCHIQQHKTIVYTKPDSYGIMLAHEMQAV